ncbi:MAG TPA: thiamine pyrophosphate-binding protein [Vicinamibacterales bacterium]|nr:thiamine pyrophosphate-binding protein [Vicinamibacterales bacterium]
MTTAGAVAQALAEAGITKAFGLPGGEVLVLIDELRKVGIDFVLMRHEANAGLAAAVYGKIKRQPGVVIATLGPGAANLLLPVANSYLDQEPLLAITAQLPDDFPPSHTHQLLPLHQTFQPMCKVAETVTQSNAGDAVGKALAACMDRPYGVSYLTLSAREAAKPLLMIGRRYSEGPPTRPMANPAARAADLRSRCAMANKPLVLIGLGMDSRRAAPLRRWLDEWQLPFAVTPKIKGIVDETSPNFVGVISGMAADGVMVDALKAADLLIGFGLDPVEIDKTWHAELPIQWVLEARNATDVAPGDAHLVSHLALLEELVAGPPPRNWGRPFASFQQQRSDLLKGQPGAPGVMWPGDIVRALADAVPAETIVTTDVGSHKYLFGQFWPSRHPDTFWMSNGLSGMAYGLSAAIGAKLACPDVPVLAAVGDGGFSMNAQELETADRVGAPFVTVVLEDHSYSLIKLAQENRKLEPYRMDFNPIDNVKMAEACGVQALRTSNPDEMAAAVKRAVSDRKSLVVAVPVHYADYRKMF